MKINLFRFLISSLLVVILVSFSVMQISGAGSQSWNLDSHEDSDILTPGTLCQMELTSGPGDDGQSGQILLGSHSSQIWIADQYANSKVVFGGGDGAWILELVTDSSWNTDGSDCVIEIGEWNGTIFNKFNSAVQSNPPLIIPILGNQLIITYVWQSNNEIVYKGHYLAISVTNLDNDDHVIYCGESEESTCLTSTGYNPGYPNPEQTPYVPASSTTAVAVLTTGLMGAMVFLLVRRKKLQP